MDETREALRRHDERVDDDPHEPAQDAEPDEQEPDPPE
jgi:hypothetical protein